ncbi:aldo/keto reductase [candidate division KSB1 bacterium]|nr:aldo/keto reductase [candidate division KSB1 bacterium]
MAKISRRKFLKYSLSSAGAIATNSSDVFAVNDAHRLTEKIDQVILGKSGIQVSRLAWGTGTHGWKFVSDQTKLGTKGFIDLAQHAFVSGITFFDVADIYGSHTCLKEVLKHIPREKIVIMSKIWTRSNDWLEYKGAQAALDRFRKEIGTDVIDIVLLHCQVSPNWQTEFKKARDVLSKAKADRIIQAHGVSCHSLDALKAAANSDWVDILLSRINHSGAKMDDKPEKVMPLLKQAHDSGKGVLGMKIYGCGDLIEEEQRETSLKYVLSSGNVDAMTIGFENGGQIDDTITRINRILKK